MGGIAPFFDRNVEKWLLYTESVKGRLLHELSRHHLDQQLRRITRPLRVLDAGCGLGDMALPLICRAEKLVLLDFSEKMIEESKKRMEARYPAIERERIIFVNAALEDPESCLPEGSFDLVICHNTLEYVEEPGAALASLVKRLAPGGILSLVVANRFSEAFKLAFVKFDLAGARLALHAGNSTADLFDNAPKRTFSFEELDAMAAQLDLKAAARHGIRIFTDYLPENFIEDQGNFQLLLALEREAASKPPYIYAARFLQVILSR
jgi:S-adenosylmethionine-dependent methyltransferase